VMRCNSNMQCLA